MPKGCRTFSCASVRRGAISTAGAPLVHHNGCTCGRSGRATCQCRFPRAGLACPPLPCLRPHAALGWRDAKSEAGSAGAVCSAFMTGGTRFALAWNCCLRRRQQDCCKPRHLGLYRLNLYSLLCLKLALVEDDELRPVGILGSGAGGGLPRLQSHRHPHRRSFQPDGANLPALPVEG